MVCLLCFRRCLFPIPVHSNGRHQQQLQLFQGLFHLLKAHDKHLLHPFRHPKERAPSPRHRPPLLQTPALRQFQGQRNLGQPLRRGAKAGQTHGLIAQLPGKKTGIARWSSVFSLRGLRAPLDFCLSLIWLFVFYFLLAIQLLSLISTTACNSALVFPTL